MNGRLVEDWRRLEVRFDGRLLKRVEESGEQWRVKRVKRNGWSLELEDENGGYEG